MNQAGPSLLTDVSAPRSSIDSGYNTIAHPTPRVNKDAFLPADEGPSADIDDMAPPKIIHVKFKQRKDTPDPRAAPEDVWVNTFNISFASVVVHEEPDIVDPHMEDSTPRQSTLIEHHAVNSPPIEEGARDPYVVPDADSDACVHDATVRGHPVGSYNPIPQPTWTGSALMGPRLAGPRIPYGARKRGSTSSLSSLGVEIPPTSGQGFGSTRAPEPRPLHDDEERAGMDHSNTVRISAMDAAKLHSDRIQARVAALPPPQPPPTGPDERPHGLSMTEQWWRDHGPLFEVYGYRLRPRYQPNWQPCNEEREPRPWWTSKAQVPEDYIPILPEHPDFMDAYRISDGYPVMMKIINTTDHPHEVHMSLHASSDYKIACDPRNKVVPVHTLIPSPWAGCLILVMPLLRRFDDPGFDTMGEAVGFFKQMFEGLHLSHKNNVVHRNICKDTIMMDPRPIYLDGYHPVKTNRTSDLKKRASHMTRTDRPVKYFYTNMSEARMYPKFEGVYDRISLGKDGTVPEHRGDTTKAVVNPFAVDVYCLGNVLRTEFLEKRKGFGFIKELVDDMTQKDLRLRPTAAEACARWTEIQKGLSKKMLRKRCVTRGESVLKNVSKSLCHWRHRIFYQVQDIPPVPLPFY